MKQQILLFLIWFSGFGFAQNQSDSTKIDSCQISVPNVLTINCHYGSDYLFQVYSDCVIQEFQITIYNRWGEKLYYSSSITETWYAHDQPDGVYFYMLCATTINGKDFDERGQFTILK